MFKSHKKRQFPTFSVSVIVSAVDVTVVEAVDPGGSTKLWKYITN